MLEKSETYPKVTSAYNIQTKEFFKTKTTTGCFHYSNVKKNWVKNLIEINETNISKAYMYLNDFKI